VCRGWFEGDGIRLGGFHWLSGHDEMEIPL
jgi:hypothetical protein